MSIKDQLKKISAIGVFTAAGLTSLFGANANGDIDIQAPAPVHQTVKKDAQDTKISTSFGTVSYSITQNGVQYTSNVRGVNTSAIQPAVYETDDMYECGPLKDYSIGTLSMRVDHVLRDTIIKESIAQNLKQKGEKQSLSSAEQDFLKYQQQTMESWGLKSTISKDGRVELVQNDPAGHGKFSFKQAPYKGNTMTALQKVSGNTR